jgi:predicted phage-related endonuclease
MTTTTANPVARAIAAIVPGVQTVGLPPAVSANIRELHDVRAALKVLKEREETLKGNVRGYIETQGTDAVTDGTVSAFRSTGSRTGVDPKRLEALYPKVYEDVKTSTSYVQIRVEVPKVKG